jgi:endonuclease G
MTNNKFITSISISTIVSIAAITFHAISVLANPLDEKCPSFVPSSYPTIEIQSQIAFKCMKRYGVAYDVTNKTPIYVATKLTADELGGTVKRINEFHVDDTVPTAKPSDFVGTNYDKGHLAEAELFTTDADAMYESFDMINMHAQWYNFNRGIWHALENYSHKLALKYGTVYIISGTVYSHTSKHIGSGVVVPDFSWKVIIIPTTNTVEAYLIPNGEHEHELFKKYKVNIRDIEIASSLKFN